MSGVKKEAHSRPRVLQRAHVAVRGKKVTQHVKRVRAFAAVIFVRAAIPVKEDIPLAAIQKISPMLA
jgi:hypothetical protein